MATNLAIEVIHPMSSMPKFTIVARMLAAVESYAVSKRDFLTHPDT
jgi:hypothetical protein